MVNLTQICMKYYPFYLRRPETRTVYFRRQALFRLTGTFYGLSRNCWRVAIKKWRKKQEYATEFRKIYSSNLSDLHAQRLLAAVEEHNFKMEHFMSSLTKCNIELSRKSLAHLAIYEPRTFKSLIDLAKASFYESNKDDKFVNLKFPDGVDTREMLKVD